MQYINFLIDFIRQISHSFGNKIAHVSTYTRELPINLERMFENAIDWEHLPWLHSSTFAEIEIIESGNWGWKAKAFVQPKSFTTYMTLELRLDRTQNRWVTRTLSGLGKGTEIWTYALPLEENKIKVVVDFHVPKLPFFLKKKYANQYNALYAQLYDEDLWMMADRQTQLNQETTAQNTIPIKQLHLGKLTDIKANLPYLFEFNHRSYRLVELDNTLIAHTTTCPHMLGPLNDADVNQGILVCPWHGYKFDLKTRKCISGQRCKLAPAPTIEVDVAQNEVIAVHFRQD